MKKHLLDAEIRNQIQKENISDTGADCLTGRNRTPITVVITITEGQETLTIIQWDKKQQTPGAYIPKNPAVIPMPDIWAHPHQLMWCYLSLLFRLPCKCPHAKANTNYKKPNPIRFQIPCQLPGNHVAGYLECPCLQVSTKAMKIAIKKVFYKEERKLCKAATWLTKTNKNQLQGQMKKL